MLSALLCRKGLIKHAYELYETLADPYKFDSENKMNFFFKQNKILLNNYISSLRHKKNNPQSYKSA